MHWLQTNPIDMQFDASVHDDVKCAATKSAGNVIGVIEFCRWVAWPKPFASSPSSELMIDDKIAVAETESEKCCIHIFSFSMRSSVAG